jgi:hypothetical protein
VAEVRVIAVDWSGRAGARQSEHIWIAEAARGRLVDLRNGLERDAVADHLIAAAARHPRLVVGLDFAFSLPAWWIRQERLADVRAVWRRLGDAAEELIRTCPPPFWGASGSTALPPARRFRRTERELRAAGLPAKSPFQLAGAGAVGVGSLRGMPILARLAEEHGFAVWPFAEPGWPRVVEIYPRVFTGPVDKSRFRCRHAHLAARFPEGDPVLLERAAGSEDAFDAAVSALAMSAGAAELAALGGASDEVERLEGRVWLPTAARELSAPAPG